MPASKLFLTACLTASAALATLPARAQSLTTLYSFKGNATGANPYAPLLALGGALFGTTITGGPGGNGTVFKFDAKTRTPKVLHAFTGAPDGAHPFDGLTDHAGTLYGTTAAGGPAQFGTVFAINPATGAETVLHGFSGTDGASPFGGLIYHRNQLYGTTLDGGSSNHGTVFEIDPKSGTEQVLHSFHGTADGIEPAGALLYLHGALFGTTAFGGGGCGRSGCGVVFKVDPATGAETVVHKFDSADDARHPEAPLIIQGGTLYGTGSAGGASGQGAVFAINPSTGAETVLYSFAGAPDGAAPYGAIIYQNGLLYGTTAIGGTSNKGTIFAINPATGAESLRYSLAAHTDGKNPQAALIGRQGSFYGTAYAGGADGNGTVFQFVP